MMALTMDTREASAAAVTEAALAIETLGLGKQIDERPILREVNLAIPAGQFVALLGANGAGKSTLLKVLSTLTPATSGEVRLFGKPLNREAAALRARIGLVSHQSMLYRELSARENLEFFAKLYNLPDPAARAREGLEAVGLWHRANDPVRDFSRGMTQRVSIARALIHEPELVLADEPFAGLDVAASGAIEGLLTGAHRAGRTVVLVNHDIAQSLRLAERVVVLHEGAVMIDQSVRGVSAQDVIEAIEEEGRR
jgi:heme exporter protein A